MKRVAMNYGFLIDLATDLPEHAERVAHALGSFGPNAQPSPRLEVLETFRKAVEWVFRQELAALGGTDAGFSCTYHPGLPCRFSLTDLGKMPAELQLEAQFLLWFEHATAEKVWTHYVETSAKNVFNVPVHALIEEIITEGGSQPSLWEIQTSDYTLDLEDPQDCD